MYPPFSLFFGWWRWGPPFGGEECPEAARKENITEFTAVDSQQEVLRTGFVPVWPTAEQQFSVKKQKALVYICLTRQLKIFYLTLK